MSKIEDALIDLECLTQLLKSNELQKAILDVKERVGKVTKSAAVPNIVGVNVPGMDLSRLTVELERQDIDFETMLDSEPYVTKDFALIRITASVCLGAATIEVGCSIFSGLPEEYKSVLRAIDKIRWIVPEPPKAYEALICG